MSSARNWRRRRTSMSACAQSSARWRRCAGSWSPRRGRRFGSRRRPASSCRSISANAGSRLAVSRPRFSSLSQRWAIRAGFMCAPSGTRSRRVGFPGWRARSRPSAGFRARCCSTTPALSFCTMIHRAGRSFFIPGCMPSRSIGVFASGPVRRIGRAQRMRLNSPFFGLSC